VSRRPGAALALVVLGAVGPGCALIDALGEPSPGGGEDAAAIDAAAIDAPTTPDADALPVAYKFTFDPVIAAGVPCDGDAFLAGLDVVVDADRRFMVEIPIDARPGLSIIVGGEIVAASVAGTVGCIDTDEVLAETVASFDADPAGDDYVGSWRESAGTGVGSVLVTPEP
jgi:hypothetical protein